MRFPTIVACCVALMATACDDEIAAQSDGGMSAHRDAGQPDDGGVTAEGGPTWRALAALPAGPRQEVGVAVANDRIYVVGGFDSEGQPTARVESFDPTLDTWTRAPDAPRAMHHANVAAVNGVVYVLGGLGDGFAAFSNSYAFDTQAQSWSPRAAMPAGSERGASAVAVIDQKVYVAGGSRNGSRADFSAYDTLLDTWETLPDLPSARDHLVGAAVGGVFFAIGGRNGSTLTARVDTYDAANGWAQRVPMPTARAGSGATVVNGRIVVAGGEGNSDAADGIFPETEIYDSVANAWSVAPKMRTPRHGMGGATIGSVAYFPGGATRAGFGATAVVEALAP